MEDFIYFIANKSTKTIGGVQTIMRLIEKASPSHSFIELPIFHSESDSDHELLANVEVVKPSKQIINYASSVFKDLLDSEENDLYIKDSKIIVFGVQKLLLTPEELLANNEIIIFQSTRPDLTFGFPDLSEVPILLKNKVKHIDKFVCFTETDKYIIRNIIDNSDINTDITWFTIPNPSKTKRNKITKYTKNIMYLGRFDFFQKNILEYVNVHKKLEGKFTLNMYGYGPAKPALEMSGLNVLGKIDDISKVADQNSVLLLLSSSEGFGNVLVEAISVGMPIVVYDSYPAAKSIVTGGVGKLIPYGDIDLVADAVHEILKDEESFEKYSTNAYKASELYDKKHVVEKYKEVLDI